VGRYLADEWIELRTCVCGKTLAVPTSELGDVPEKRETEPRETEARDADARDTEARETEGKDA
jgi:hypothetical protein